MSELNVQLVSADRSVWSGTASIVIARTLDGDLGVLPGHAPLLAELADGVVTIRSTDDQVVVAAVHGGFISVENNAVSLLAESAALAEEIDLEQARMEMLKFEGVDPQGSDAELAAQTRAETRLRAAETRL